MTRLDPAATAPLPDLLPLPGWARARPAPGRAEEAAFRSGAVLAHLHGLCLHPAVPQPLWRDRLALAAAEVCAGLAGRREGAQALRDALHLTRAGDHPGPAGAILRLWSRAVALPVTAASLQRLMPGVSADLIAACAALRGGLPVESAAKALAMVLAGTPQAETEALILADAVLARSLGWDRLLPLLSVGVTPRDLGLRGDALRMACHRAVAAGAGPAVALAADLARRAARLRAVVPVLRSRGAERAVAVFLSQDALAPSALGFMSDRAARRLCDRLVTLGALRELTGRDTFRLYGV